MIRGYFIYQGQQIHAAHQTLQSSRQTIDQLRRGQAGPDAEAEAAARGVPAPTAMPVANKAPAAAAQGAPAVTVNGTTRGEIEAALQGMRVTTIMPGQPGVFILDKHDYSEGDELPLSKGRKARVVAVQEDGVRLTCEGMTFHLDPPAAPDLAASRKKR